MESRNIAARRRRATPRKSARTTAAPSNNKQATQGAPRRQHGAARVTPELAGQASAQRALPTLPTLPTPPQAGQTPPRPSLTRGVLSALPTMLAFVTPPPGSVGASTPRGEKQPPNGGNQGRRGATTAKTSEPLLPGPAMPSAPLTDGPQWNDDDEHQEGALSVWRDAEREPEEDEEDDPWRSLGERTSGAWLVAPSWSDRLHDWVATALPFSWRERAWRRGFWRRRILRTLTLVAVVAVVALIASGAFYIALQATHTSFAKLTPLSSATPGRGGFVVSAPNGDQNATPTTPAYIIGVWASNDTPSGGQVTLYARVTHSYGPVKNVAVLFTLQYPNGTATYGPAKTNSDGLASVKVNYGGGQGEIIFVTASTHVGGQDISADTSFTPF